MASQFLKGIVGIGFASRREGVYYDMAEVKVPLEDGGTHGEAKVQRRGRTLHLRFSKDEHTDIFDAAMSLLSGKKKAVRLGGDSFLLKYSGISNGMGWNPPPAGSDKMDVIDGSLQPQFMRSRATFEMLRAMRTEHAGARGNARRALGTPTSLFADGSNYYLGQRVQAALRSGLLKAGDPVAACIIGGSFVRVTTVDAPPADDGALPPPAPPG